MRDCGWAVCGGGATCLQRNLRLVDALGRDVEIHPRGARKPQLVASSAARERLCWIQADFAEQRAKLADDGTQRRVPCWGKIGRPEHLRELCASDRAAPLAGEIGEGKATLLPWKRLLLHPVSIHLE